MGKFKFIFKISFLTIAIFAVFFGVGVIFASEEEGVIDDTYKYAWGENVGWINFDCDECNALVTDEGLSGLAWSSQYGWIILEPENGGVVNDGEGELSGNAWSPNIGWIDFDGVTIESGDFSGYATVLSDGSRINFNCQNGASCASADFKVRTDWRPASERDGDDEEEDEEDGGGSSSSSGGRIRRPEQPSLPGIVTIITAPVENVIGSIWDFFNPDSEIIAVPEITPWAFRGIWDLLPTEAIRTFVFTPLPYEVRILASKFPELERTLQDVGINRLTDLDRLVGVTFTIPGLVELEKTLAILGVENLSDINKLRGVSLGIPGLSGPDGKILGNVGAGKIALIQGLPVAKFPAIAKRNLPAEFVFARTAGELIDLKVAVSVGEEGQVTQKISSLPGKTLRLVMKPISRARSVTGYFVFKSATPRISEAEISRESLVASPLFSLNSLVEEDPEPIQAENMLVLSSFEYEDRDGDGIYTADVTTPLVPGEYEVITIIDYIDPVLGTRQMRMIAVIDPEGYVYEKNGGKETRIPDAVVSIYWLNPAADLYELWPAKAYLQQNPQITDVRGTYSFLVPEGHYYFMVEAPGYKPYKGEVFAVEGETGVHQNIELGSGWEFFDDFDGKTGLLVVVLLLLVYNLLRNKLLGIFKRS